MATHFGKESRPLDEAARQRAQDHLSLAEALARRQYRRCGRTVPLEELQGEAQLALVHAARLFDESKGVPFGCHGTLVIRHQLVRAVTVWRRGGRLDHVRFTDLIGSNPAEQLSGLEPICPRTREAGEEAVVRELVARLRQELPPRWFLVLEHYFAYHYTLEEIAAQLDVSVERVRQLLAKAIARTRANRHKFIPL